MTEVSSLSTRSLETSRVTALPSVWPVYLVEGLASHAGNLLLVGIFFFTHQQFHWTLRQNLVLAAGQGACYVVGALSTATLSAQLSRATFLMLLQTGMIAVGVAGWLWPSAGVVTPLLLVYVMLIAAGWPALESLVSERVSGVQLSRRLAVYNLVWSGVNAATLAVSGIVIARWPAGVFVLVAAAHTIALVTVWFADFGRSALRESAPSGRTPGQTPRPAESHPEPEPSLLRQRSLALWLSRISLPATYVVVYSLSAMMPTLAVLAPLGVQQRTLVSSGWLVARFVTFAVLGVTVFWHTRPRLLLGAVVIMGVAFIGTCVRPGDVLPVGHSTAIDLPLMLGWQALLGVTMAVIYSASLYFGMVLSEGSASHGGYHEALIGLGSIVGPAVAAGADLCFPGRAGISIGAVAGLVAISFVTAAVRAAKTSSE